jgi:AbrB family looped-hinge helix DNA binding protein
MEVSITTVSKNGQIVIPNDIRNEMSIHPFDKFLVIGEGDVIIFKRMSNEVIRKEFEELMNTFTSSFKERNISREDVEEEINKYRNSKTQCV